jgi:hypothetical protein
MPTVHPRYAVTDTGEVREMLDLAARRWPDVRDRRQLLLRLVAAGSEAVAHDVDDRIRRAVRQRQLAALDHVRELVDEDRLLGDAAWR